VNNTVRLSDVCQIQPSKNEVRSSLKDSDAVTFAPMETLGINRKSLEGTTERALSDVVGSYTYFADNDVLLAKITPCFENGKLGIASGLTNGVGFGSSEYIVFRPSDRLLSDYLYYFLSQDLFRRTGAKRMTGTAGQKRITRTYVESCLIPVPSLREQEHIVAILDEAFAGLAKVRANAERSLVSLFQLADAAGFPEEPILGKKQHSLADLCEFIVDCEHKTAPTQADGIPSIRTPNIGHGFLILEGVNRVSEETYRHWTRRAEPAEGDLIFAREAPAGNVAVVPPATKLCLGQRTVLLRPKSQIVDSRFLAHLILHPVTQTRWLGHSRGATVQHVNLKDIRALSIGKLPSLEEQLDVVRKIDALNEGLDRAAANYERDIVYVDELRQSLLNQAFSGKLLRNHSTATVIPFPVRLPNISTTDLHVGVLAIAYAAHEALHKSSDFGHVKAEKIAHMVEAYVGVDLGRTPVRDAAGPNDFPHLKKVEHRADRAGYLTFARQTGGGYRVTKKSGFDSLVTKTRTALGARNQDLDKLLNLMTPMTTKQAEIFATVYAGWNNLLIDGEPITDERIVHAAREDWHSDKLSIPREKFFTAIEWIRTKGLCPEGKGKWVEAKKH
jgi:type I restriction enzyme S subunit